MYDITDYSSFSHISDWLSVIKGTDQRFPIVLLGSKYDLAHFREISWDEGVEAAESFGLDGMVECSSKTGQNVQETFLGLTRIMMNRMISNKNKTQSIII